MKIHFSVLLFLLIPGFSQLVHAQNMDSLKTVLTSVSDKEKPELWQKTLEKLYYQGFFESCKELAQEASVEFANTNNLPYLAMAHRYLSSCYVNDLLFDSARHHIGIANQYMHLLSPSQKGRIYQANGYLYRNLYTNVREKMWDDSCQYFQKLAIKQFEAIHDTSSILVNIYSLAIHYITSSRHDDALKLHKKYFLLSKDFNDEIARSVNAKLLAEIQIELKQFDEGIVNAKKALKEARRLRNHAGDAAILLLRYYLQSGQKEAGLELLDQMNEENEYELLSEDQTAFYWYCYQVFYWGQPEKVLQSLFRLKEFYQSQGKTDKATSTDKEIGIQYIEMGQYQKGVDYINRGIALVDEKDYYLQMFYQQILTFGYLKLNKCDKADVSFSNYVTNYQQDLRIKDSTYAARLQTKTNQLYVEFETEKKEAEIVLLKEQEEKKDAQLAESRTQVTALVMGVLALIVLAFVFLRGRSKLAIANREISRQNAEIQAANQEIRQQNEQLKISNKQLTLLHEEKDSLMQIVAHDLKSPLDNITSLFYLSMQPGVADDERRNYQEMVRKEHSRGKELIKDLLEVHGVERGMIKPNYTKASIIHVIAEVINSFDEQARSKDITVHFDREGMPVIPTDRKWLSQIMANLLSNAIKFSPRQKEIRVKVADKATDVYISVEDEGPGFTAEDQQKVFRKFQRLSAQPTGGEGSTGLGLSIVKSYVEKLGGKINLESQLSNGSRFLVILSKSIKAV